MADVTKIHKYSFTGYDKNLFRPSVSLSDLLPQITVDKWCTFTTSTSSSEIAYVLKENTFAFNRIVSTGAIPFIYIVKTTVNNVNYLNRIGCEVTANNGNIRVDYQTRYARASDIEIEDTSLITDRTLNDLVAVSMSSHSTDAYYTTDVATWASGLISFPVECVTNLPIFLVADDFNWNNETTATKDVIHQFMQHVLSPESLVENCDRVIEIINGETEVVPETTEYYCYCTANQYTVDKYGNSTKTSQPQVYRGFRIRTKGRASLYAVEGIEDGALKYMINYDDAEICYYSYDGDTWQNVIGSPTSLPFDYVWRKWVNEIGTFYASGILQKTFYTNCLIFDNKADSDDYNDTGEGEEKASNFGEISDDNPPRNPTGESDSATTFGQVYTRAFFSQQYICSASAIQEISNGLFDTTQGGISGIFDDIKKGLEMYGEGGGVINAVQSCMFYPFDLNAVFTNSISQNYIYFGGYKFDLQNSTVNKILYPNGFIDFGSIKIERTFNSYRDYSPYQRLYVYLPYLAWYELDINKYLGKTVNVKYFIDTRTGLCMAVLSANSVMCDYMTGQIGVAMPLTLTDFSAYASAQIRTLLGGGSNVIGSGGGMGSKLTEGYKNFTGGLVEGGAVGLGVGLGVAGVGVASAFQGAKTLYGLTQNNINNFNKTIGSGSTSMLNQYLPQEVCFMFEIQDADITPNELSLQGYPSNASGTIGSFSGYLEVDTVNLVCADATANEKAQIVSMLKSGVYI